VATSTGLLDEGREVAIESSGSIVVNDARYRRELALAGVGLAFEPCAKKRFAISRQVGATLYQLAIAALVSGVSGWGTSSLQARKP
jgi:hypothetical protein